MTEIAVIDLETTGLHYDKGDRIIEISLIRATIGPGYKMGIKKFCGEIGYEQRINPRRSVAPAATAVHGITEAELEHAPFFEDVADDILSYLDGVSVLVAHNMDFDGPFFANEVMRVGRDLPGFETFCTMESGRWATATGKLPSLKELCFTCRVDYDDSKAHAARYDTLVTLKCLGYGLQNGLYQLP